jgi:hypothetical protein
MPSTAPSEIVKGAAGRRRLPDFLAIPDQSRCIQAAHYSSRPESKIYFYATAQRCFSLDSLSKQLSGYRVERGRVGEVVSLVGDCRPPPPGNPHRLPIHEWRAKKVVWRCRCLRNPIDREARFGAARHQIWGNHLARYLHFSFNIHGIISNLKKLNTSEYFKENRLYFYCTENQPVLEFGSFHSYLCGLIIVELPSIAITNVLETRA